MKKILIGCTIAVITAVLLVPACKHELEPITLPPIDPGDTTVVPPPPDAGDTTGVPCDPDTVYFQNQILPLFLSNCAMSGCHDVQSHKEGVILTDYALIMQKIKPFNPNQSKNYQVIVTGDAEDRMPPAPAAPLTQAQVDLLKTWILQGALNNGCNEGYGQCDTAGVTYTNFVQPLVANKCQGCHGAVNPGAGIKLTTYNEVKASALTGKFYGSISWSAGTIAMPQNGAKLSSCYIAKVQAWINAGMPQ